MSQKNWLRRACIGSVVAAAGLAGQANAQQHPVTLQLFETPWPEATRMAADIFASGYGAMWLPPVGRTSDPNSVGYDPFDRFDLGTPSNPTQYGTETDFRLMVEALQRADQFVYIDMVMNHNSGRTSDPNFQDAGGWPAFWMDSETPAVIKGPTDPWGDFHGGNEFGFLQSTNPNDPNYNELLGDLVALVDIAHESDNQFIRHPVEAGNPDNIPAGTFRNLPNPANARLYPDTDLTPFVFQNPGTARNPAPNPPGFWEITIYPYNLEDPMAGDPVLENASALLVRQTQWMLDVFNVDGFRLDASKHAPTWFWDNLWDNAVYNRWTAPDGTITTPVSFGENVFGNDRIVNESIRKDGFGNRDSLDLNGASALRGVVNANGLSSWSSALGSHLDVADNGFQDGSLGFNHVFSHDNGSVGNGDSPPPVPTIRQQGMAAMAYGIMRPGPFIVYHNGRMLQRPPTGFWPRAGTPNAIGTDRSGNGNDDTITNLIYARNQVGRGEFHIINGTDPVNQSIDDVMIFERRGNGVANAIVAVNDSYAEGITTRCVTTTFPPGTRLRELSGTAASAIADPQDAVADVLVVGQDQRVCINVPHNRNTSGVDHGLGFVVYAPTLPTAELFIDGATSVLDPDADRDFVLDAVQEPAQRRVTVPVVTSETFDIRVVTAQTDPLDDNVDDNAVFMFNRNFADLNGNGSVDIGSGAGDVSGFEFFLTSNNPLSAGGINGTDGEYVQTINAADLPRGLNHLTVNVFRQRPGNTDPIFTQLRQSIYLDVGAPEITVGPEPLRFGEGLITFDFTSEDATAGFLFARVNLDENADLLTELGTGDQANPTGRLTYTKTFTNPGHGWHTLAVVPLDRETRSIHRFDVDFFVDTCVPDINDDGLLNIDDFSSFVSAFFADDFAADQNEDGQLDIDDFSSFVSNFFAGCDL